MASFKVKLVLYFLLLSLLPVAAAFWGFSTVDDQRLAGLIMKIGGGLLLWLVIAVIFFRWAGEEDRRIAARRQWQDLDRELSRMGTTTS